MPKGEMSLKVIVKWLIKSTASALIFFGIIFILLGGAFIGTPRGDYFTAYGGRFFTIGVVVWGAYILMGLVRFVLSLKK